MDKSTWIFLVFFLWQITGTTFVIKGTTLRGLRSMTKRSPEDDVGPSDTMKQRVEEEADGEIEELCAICMDRRPGDFPITGVFNCSHNTNFCSTCIEKYARSNEGQNCPLCRIEFTPVETIQVSNPNRSISFLPPALHPIVLANHTGKTSQALDASLIWPVYDRITHHIHRHYGGLRQHLELQAQENVTILAVDPFGNNTIIAEYKIIFARGPFDRRHFKWPFEEHLPPIDERQFFAPIDSIIFESPVPDLKHSLIPAWQALYDQLPDGKCDPHLKQRLRILSTIKECPTLTWAQGAEGSQLKIWHVTVKENANSKGDVDTHIVSVRLVDRERQIFVKLPSYFCNSRYLFLTSFIYTATPDPPETGGFPMSELPPEVQDAVNKHSRESLIQDFSHLGWQNLKRLRLYRQVHLWGHRDYLELQSEVMYPDYVTIAAVAMESVRILGHFKRTLSDPAVYLSQFAWPFPEVFKYPWTFILYSKDTLIYQYYSAALLPVIRDFLKSNSPSGVASLHEAAKQFLDMILNSLNDPTTAVHEVFALKVRDYPTLLWRTENDERKIRFIEPDTSDTRRLKLVVYRIRLDSEEIVRKHEMTLENLTLPLQFTDDLKNRIFSGDDDDSTSGSSDSDPLGIMPII